jgi:sugar O-acyltransferase (sialic acid O-acetyltransferase NeuD family)
VNASGGKRIEGGRRLAIVGAGGHGRVCADVARTAGFSIAGFVDIRMPLGRLVNDIPVIARGLAEIQGQEDLCVLIAIGENARRGQLVEEAKALGLSLPAVIHPAAVISPTATIGLATVVMPGAVIAANAQIGQSCIINHGATVDHDNVLEDNVQLCPGVHLAGNVHVGTSAFLGTGASVIPGISIGADAVVAAGAVVTLDIERGQKVAGVPARPLPNSE